MQVRFPGMIRYIIKIATFTGRSEICRGWDNALLERKHGGYQFMGARGTQAVTVHRFRRRHQQPVGVVRENLAQGTALHYVVGKRTRTVGIDIIHCGR